MISVSQIESIVNQNIDPDYFLVEAKVQPGNRILVSIDKMNGYIALQECASLHRKIDEALNRDLEDFELEVSSPGLGYPLKVKKQFIKNIGQEIDVLKKNGQRTNGILIAADDNEIVLETKKRIRTEENKNKNKEWQTARLNLMLADIKEVKIIVKI